MWIWPHRPEEGCRFSRVGGEGGGGDYYSRGPEPCIPPLENLFSSKPWNAISSLFAGYIFPHVLAVLGAWKGQYPKMADAKGKSLILVWPEASIGKWTMFWWTIWLLTKYSPFKRVWGSIKASCRSHFNTISLLLELKSSSSRSKKVG